MKVYGFWTEDEGASARRCDMPTVFATAELANEVLASYLKAIDCLYWLEDGLAGVYEITVVEK